MASVREPSSVPFREALTTPPDPRLRKRRARIKGARGMVRARQGADGRTAMADIDTNAADAAGVAQSTAQTASAAERVPVGWIDHTGAVHPLAPDDPLLAGVPDGGPGHTGAIPTVVEVRDAVAGLGGGGGVVDLAVFQFLPPFVLAVCAGAFWVIWFNNRHMKAAGLWGLATTFGALGFIADIARGPFAALPLSYFVTGCFVATAWLFVGGIARRYRKRVPVPWLALVTGIIGGLVSFPWFVDPNETLRTLYICLGSSMLFAVAWLAMDWRAMRGIDHAIAATVALVAAQFVALPMWVVAQQGAIFVGDAAGGGTFLAWLYLSVAATSLVAAVVLFVALGMDIVNELQHRSDTDAMTGMRNRLAFEIAAERAIAEAERRNGTVSLVVTDIDLFKSVNDTWGHGVGDTVIRAFAASLAASCRKADVVGRVGGEEFCILLPTAALRIAERVASHARNMFEMVGTEALAASVERPDRGVTASFGIAEWQRGETYADLFARADAALYRAKNGGRNRVEGFSIGQGGGVVPLEYVERRQAA